MCLQFAKRIFDLGRFFLSSSGELQRAVSSFLRFVDAARWEDKRGAKAVFPRGGLVQPTAPSKDPFNFIFCPHGARKVGALSAVHVDAYADRHGFLPVWVCTAFLRRLFPKHVHKEHFGPRVLNQILDSRGV